MLFGNAVCALGRCVCRWQQTRQCSGEIVSSSLNVRLLCGGGVDYSTAAVLHTHRTVLLPRRPMLFWTILNTNASRRTKAHINIERLRNQSMIWTLENIY